MCAWHTHKKKIVHTKFETIRYHFDKKTPYFMVAKQTSTSHLPVMTTCYLGKPQTHKETLS